MFDGITARGCDSAKLIYAIETKSLRGKGKKENPCRIVTQYWDMSGKLLAEKDPELGTGGVEI